jgi:hypothetical protein
MLPRRQGEDKESDWKILVMGANKFWLKRQQVSPGWRASALDLDRGDEQGETPLSRVQKSFASSDAFIRTKASPPLSFCLRTPHSRLSKLWL